MKNIIRINGEERLLTNEELKKLGYRIASKSYIICDKCLDRIVNVIINPDSDKPKINT